MKAAMIISTVCLLMCVSLVGCGGGSKEEDAREVGNEFAAAVDKYAADVDSATNADEMAEAIDGLTDKMKSLVPKMKALQEKYPELKGGGDLPPELKDVQTKVDAASQKIISSMMKMMAYANDPNVTAAQERMQAAMEGMN